jgi:hypothetical protein
MHLSIRTRKLSLSRFQKVGLGLWAMAPLLGAEDFQPGTWSIGSSYTQESAARIADDDTTLATKRALAWGSYGTHLADRIAVGIDVRSEYAEYSFDPGINFSTVEDGDADKLGYLSEYTWGSLTLTPQWTALGGVGIVAAKEFGSSDGGILGVSALTGLRYQFSSRLAFTGGIIIDRAIGNFVTAIPLIGIEWTILPDLQLKLFGVQAALTYQATKSISFFADIREEFRDYRLASDNLNANGILRDRFVPVLGGVQWTPLAGMTVSGSGGIVILRKLRVDNSDGKELTSASNSGGGLWSLAASYTF